MHANFRLNVITRSAGRSAVGASAYRSASAVACAAYRAGDRVQDDRYDKTHDYTNKHNVMHAQIITPDGAPEWMKDRQQLWNAVEAGEKRKDARLAKEVVLVLPRNLTFEQHKAVVEEFVHDNITKHGLIADYAIHNPDASDGGKNPHAHIMFTLRPVEGNGFGKKLTGYANVLDSPDLVPQWRNAYEKLLNNASEQASSEIRFDMRNYKQKGIDRQPQPKIGPKVTYLEKRGYQTEWGKEVRQVIHQNKAKSAQAGHQFYNQATHHISRVVDHVRDDIAHKYYEVMYGAKHAYEEENQQHHSRGYER